MKYLRKVTEQFTIIERLETEMTTSELIIKLCAEQHISIAELARRIGQSRQNLYNKLRRDSVSISELNQIADAVGMKFEAQFIAK